MKKIRDLHIFIRMEVSHDQLWSVRAMAKKHDRHVRVYKLLPDTNEMWIIVYCKK
jgi:hypothetical protein